MRCDRPGSCAAPAGHGDVGNQAAASGVDQVSQVELTMPPFTRAPTNPLRLLRIPFAVAALSGNTHAEPRQDAHALATQALSHLDALYAFAWRLSRDRIVAEDLVQETFARAMAGSQSFVPGTYLKAWLFRILRNAFLDLRRREGRSPLRAVDDPPDTASDAKPEQLRRLVARDIEGALQALSEDRRTVVLLDVEGFSEQEIATVMDCAVGTVKSRLARARAALRVQLREYAR
jgi:RNA polymerase sigma-70 factor (ECF subfamily)